MLADIAEMAGIECVTLGKNLNIGDLKNPCGGMIWRMG
jgi:hypothetical protein